VGVVIRACGRIVSWWDGEYEGECVLPEGHEPNDVHYDEMGSWFDDLNDEVDPADVPDVLKGMVPQ
jgi:hypothetical protein